MKKEKVIVIVAVLIMAVLQLSLVLVATKASASFYDFDSLAVGTYSNILLPDATLSYTKGYLNHFDVINANPGPPISGNALFSYSHHQGPDPFLVVFSYTSSIHYVSIGVGDYGADDDEAFLAAYDSSGNLLDSDYYYNPAGYYGGDYLSVSSSSRIAYAKFWEEGSYAGAVYWDNLSFSNNGPTVPEPSTFILVGAGLVGVGLLRKKFSR
jgi:hypothetical protein